MKHNKNKGFTIIESLLFLAVSGAIFISVAILISGQLGKYQARDAVNQVESVMRGIMNDVGNGYFPQVGQEYNCIAGNPAPDVDPLGPGENRGTNTGATGCMIAGKSIQFTDDGMLVQTLVVSGNRVTFPENTTNLAIVEGLDEVKNYKWGVKPKTPGQKYYVLYNNYKAGQNAESGTFVSGSQDIGVYDSSLNAVSGPAGKVCLENGDSYSSLNIANNSSTIQAEYKDESCE